MDTKNSIFALCAVCLIGAAWLSLSNRLERIELESKALRQTLTAIADRWEAEGQAKFLSAQERMDHLKEQVRGWYDPRTARFNVCMPLELYKKLSKENDSRDKEIAKELPQ